MSDLTRRSALASLAGASAAGLAAPAIAQGRREWRMVTSWPKGLPGPGVTAQRLADRFAALSDGRLTLKLYPAGELVPALEVFDAVTSGVADAAHTASLYWQGKVPAAVFYTTVPFGLLPSEHLAWLEQGGGQALWDELYAPFGLKPFVGGNTGPSMGGWFPRPLGSAEDVKGLTIRVQGLGGEVYRRLGAAPVSIPAGELSTALSSGVVDAVEFLSPSSDLALGLQRSAKNYYYPGFNKPNGGSELIVARREWGSLPKDLAAIVEHACKAEHGFALGEIGRMNEEAYAALLRDHGVKSLAFPQDFVEKARAASEDIVAELGAASPIAGRVLDSYRKARERSGPWSAVSLQAFLAAREA